MKNPPIKLILFILLVFFALAVFLPKNFSESRDVIFKVAKGEGSRDIAINLEKQDLIYWGPIFRIYVYFSGASKKLQAGTYLLSTSMNIPEITSKMTRGDTLKVKVTIPEGFDSEQIYQKISGFSEVQLSELAKEEGYLFPDTYEIPYGVAGQEIIKMMTDNFNSKVTPELVQAVEKQEKTLNDIIIMASILEREVITKEEKELASDVLWKRLEVGMPLQVDSAPETYEKKDLPQNPICNPGFDSILAAIYPKSNVFWYYLSTPEGETIFSKTLQEHNIAKAKYLK